jgi:hypothetical protein
MLCREIIVVCSDIHTKHINTVRGQNVELLNVELAVHIVTSGFKHVIACNSATPRGVLEPQYVLNARNEGRPAEQPIACPIDLPCVRTTSAKFGLHAATGS